MGSYPGSVSTPNSDNAGIPTRFIKFNAKLAKKKKEKRNDSTAVRTQVPEGSR